MRYNCRVQTAVHEYRQDGNEFWRLYIGANNKTYDYKRFMTLASAIAHYEEVNP
jgi:hypothetical protein